MCTTVSVYSRHLSRATSHVPGFALARIRSEWLLPFLLGFSLEILHLGDASQVPATLTKPGSPDRSGRVRRWRFSVPWSLPHMIDSVWEPQWNPMHTFFAACCITFWSSNCVVSRIHCRGSSRWERPGRIPQSTLVARLRQAASLSATALKMQSTSPPPPKCFPCLDLRSPTSSSDVGLCEATWTVFVFW